MTRGGASDGGVARGGSSGEVDPAHEGIEDNLFAVDVEFARLEDFMQQVDVQVWKLVTAAHLHR